MMEDQSNSQEIVNDIEMGPTSKLNESQSQSLDKSTEDYSIEKTRTQRLKQRISKTSKACFCKFYYLL